MQIHFDFYQQEELAQAFFELQQLTYPWLDLKWARDNGHLAPEVAPFGLFENGRALSILNATSSEIVLGDRTIKAVQLGTVTTHPDFRNRGFSRRLINEVFKQYRETTSVVFLYANDSVLEFYPKFGFERVQETQFTLPLRPTAGEDFRKLDPKDQRDRELIFDRFDRRVHLSKACGVQDYRVMAKWYAVTFFADNLWFSEHADVLLVASVEDGKVFIQDVVASKPVPAFFSHFDWPEVDEAVLQFVPDQFEGTFTPMPVPTGDALFVRGSLPTNDPIRIPELAHT